MTNIFNRLMRSLTGGGAQPRPPEALEPRLAVLEQEAEIASDGFQGVPLNRAGDLCFGAGDRDRALRYYGRAIDAYLQDEQPEAARAVAQKIIRLHPNAVRTLCTLTWLDLAAGHVADAIRHANAYVAAAMEGGRQDLARPHLLEMAKTVSDSDFRETVAEGLEKLGFEEDASEVDGWQNGKGPAGVEDPSDLRECSFAAAVGANAKGEDEGAAA